MERLGVGVSVVKGRCSSQQITYSRSNADSCPKTTIVPIASAIYVLKLQSRHVKTSRMLLPGLFVTLAHRPLPELHLVSSGARESCQKHIMKMSTSRRAGASLIAFLSEAPCKFAPRRAFISRQTRPLTSTSIWRQQQSEASANAQQVQHELSPSDESEPLRSLTDGLEDPPPVLSEDERQVDWTRSFHGLSSSPFTKEQADILQQPLDFNDIEIKPDGIVYLPEIKYRRILNRAFGPGGWGLAPRGETIVTQKTVTREYGLVCGGR